MPETWKDQALNEARADTDEFALLKTGSGAGTERRETRATLLGTSVASSTLGRGSDGAPVQRTAAEEREHLGVETPTELLGTEVVGSTFGRAADGSPVQRTAAEQVAHLATAQREAEEAALHLIPIYGQSNATGSVHLSQTWRTPMNWLSYPPGYAGEADGGVTPTITEGSPSFATVRTLNAGRTAFEALVYSAYGYDTEGLSRGLMDTLATAFPARQYAHFSHGQGGSAITVLDKPTSAQITAGTADGVTIPVDSAERLMQDAEQDIRSILDYDFADCATKYYQGMWLAAKCIQLAAAEGRSTVVPCFVWIQGESDSSNANYVAQLTTFYDNYAGDLRLLTGQESMPTMVMDMSCYSSQGEQGTGPGSAFQEWVDNAYDDDYGIDGALGLYTPEEDRVNDHFFIDTTKDEAARLSSYTLPNRRWLLAAVRYSITNRIHMHPHAGRAYGEKLGRAIVRGVLGNGGAVCMRPRAIWIEGTSIVVDFEVPVPPIAIATSDTLTDEVPKPNSPYGLQLHRGPTQIALTEFDVVVEGDTRLRITPATQPLAGDVLSYVKNCRSGALADSDVEAPLYTDREGSPNNLRNYCVPFELRVRQEDIPALRSGMQFFLDAGATGAVETGQYASNDAVVAWRSQYYTRFADASSKLDWDDPNGLRRRFAHRFGASAGGWPTYIEDQLIGGKGVVQVNSFGRYFGIAGDPVDAAAVTALTTGAYTILIIGRANAGACGGMLATGSGLVAHDHANAGLRFGYYSGANGGKTIWQHTKDAGDRLEINLDTANGDPFLVIIRGDASHAGEVFIRQGGVDTTEAFAFTAGRRGNLGGLLLGHIDSSGTVRRDIAVCAQWNRELSTDEFNYLVAWASSRAPEVTV